MPADDVACLIDLRYREKHARIRGTGFELSPESLHADGYEVLSIDDEPICAFRCSESRLEDRRVVSNLLVLVEGRSKEAQELIRTYLSANKQRVEFVIESYLQDELALIEALGGEVVRRTVRLLRDGLDAQPESGRDSEDFTIENFRIGQDEERLVDIFNQTFADLAAPIDVVEVQGWIQSSIFRPEHYLFAVRDKTVGFIALEMNAATNFSYLQEIGVLEQARGTGVAEGLIVAGFGAARREGISRMGTGVLESNRQGVRFFEKWAFQHVYTKSFFEIT